MKFSIGSWEIKISQSKNQEIVWVLTFDQREQTTYKGNRQANHRTIIIVFAIKVASPNQNTVQFIGLTKRKKKNDLPIFSRLSLTILYWSRSRWASASASAFVDDAFDRPSWDWTAARCFRVCQISQKLRIQKRYLLNL